MGLDGRQKMSKSLDNHIDIAAPGEETRKRVLTAFTDPQRTHRNIRGRPSVCNVYSLHKIFNPGEVEKVYEECTTAKRGCVECKEQLAEGMNRYLEPLRERRREYEAGPGYIDEVLEEGAKRAKIIARETIAEVTERMGLA